MSQPRPLIRAMTAGELDLALEWAAAEGWNPGLDDAAAFGAADPEGLLIAEIGGEPAASLSIARFGGRHAFLGLFICRPEFRGRGVGLALWQEGLARLAPEVTGLDGVPAQQANYARAGFAPSHRTLRYAGPLVARRPDRTEPLAPAHLNAALALDRAVTGFDRGAFLADWLTGARSRRGRALVRDGRLAGLGLLRDCREGVKIGPLIAPDRMGAEALLDGLAALAPGAAAMIDIPEPNEPAVAMVRERGLTAVFETARMWRGPAPAQDLARTFGVATLELG